MCQNRIYQNYMRTPFICLDVSGELGGMPISTVHCNANHQPTVETTLKKIEPSDLPDETFVHPKGYQLEKLDPEMREGILRRATEIKQNLRSS